MQFAEKHVGVRLIFINPHRLFHGVWLPQWLESRPEISEKAKKLYAHLTYFAGGKGCAWPTFNTLAEKLHVSRRHLIRLVNELTRYGLISVMNVSRPGKGSCANLYRFLWHPWMEPEYDVGVYTESHDEMPAFEGPDNPVSPSGTRVVPRSDKNVTPWSDIDVTPPSDIRVTPRVTPMSPKENKKKRLIKKSPKGASGYSVPLQAVAPDSDPHRLTAKKVEPSSGSPVPSPAPGRREPIRSEASDGAKDRSGTNAALTRKGWSIARRLMGEFWENCKVKPDLGILSGYGIRLLQSGFREIDIVSAFERALHQCHGHATVWVKSGKRHPPCIERRRYSNDIGNAGSRLRPVNGPNCEPESS